MPDYGYLLSIEHGTLYFKERHPLLLEYFVTFLKYIIMVIGGASTSINKLLLVNIVPFSPRLALRLHRKSYQILVTLSAHKWDDVLQLQGEAYIATWMF